MGTIAPATARAVVAISDARLRAEMAFDADGYRDEVETEALLLLDFASAWAEKADLGRRQAQYREDVGEDSPWLARLEREHRRDVEARLKLAA